MEKLYGNDILKFIKNNKTEKIKTVEENANKILFNPNIEIVGILEDNAKETVSLYFDTKTKIYYVIDSELEDTSNLIGYKYSVTCNLCNKETLYKKETTFVKHPNEYECYYCRNKIRSYTVKTLNQEDGSTFSTHLFGEDVEQLKIVGRR